MQFHIYSRLCNYLKELYVKSTNNINEDFHCFSTLKIILDLDSSVHYNGQYFPEDNLIKLYINIIIKDLLLEKGYDINKYEINLKTIEELELNYDLYNKIEYILAHELNHIRQNICPCNKTNIHTIDYPSCECSSILESSAESSLYNQQLLYFPYNHKSYYDAYFFERRFESLLFLLLIGKEYTIEDYYNAIFDSSNKDFYKMFNKDIYYILYLYDALLNRNNYVKNNFSTDEIDHLTLGDVTDKLGEDYILLIYKNYLLNLLYYTKNNSDFNLSDNLTLYCFARYYIIDTGESSYQQDDEYYLIYTNNFVNVFEALQNTYFEFLKNYYQVNNDDFDKELKNAETLFSYNNQKRIDQLIDKFPILETIIYQYSFSPSNNYNYYKENVEKQKSLNINNELYKLK